ncbi:MAG: hypothetical protein ABW032_09530 [Burkholderiaceae bacterium]
MPERIGPFVFTGSRGSLLEKIAPQPKDAQEAEWREHRPHLHTPPRRSGLLSLLPKPIVAWVDEETFYTNNRRLKRGFRAILPIQHHGALIQAVAEPIGAAFARARAPESLGQPSRQVVIVMAEPHGTKTGLMMYVAAVASARKEMPDVPPLALMEVTPADLDGAVEPKIGQLTTALRDAMGRESADRRSAAVEDMLEFKGAPPSPAEKNLHFFGVQVLMARTAGCRVAGIDDNRQPHRYARENAMGDNGLAQIDSANVGEVLPPILWHVGNGHLRPIHERLLARGYTVVVLSSEPPEGLYADPLPYLRRRASYRLANPGVEVLRTADQLEAEPLHFLDFAAQAGCPLGDLARLVSPQERFSLPRPHERIAAAPPSPGDGDRIAAA